jgi:hypothetical protein
MFHEQFGRIRPEGYDATCSFTNVHSLLASAFVLTAITPSYESRECEADEGTE